MMREVLRRRRNVAYDKPDDFSIQTNSDAVKEFNDIIGGVAVVIEAAHQCMTTRGVHKPGVTMVTSRMLGAFRDNPETRQEFLSAINLRSAAAGIGT